MAVYNYFYVKSNDGNTTLFTSAEKLYNAYDATVTETGITFANGEIYTYSGNKKFIGIAYSANSDLPDYAVGSTFVQGINIVYIVEEQPKEYTLRIDGVEVTDYENVIVNGVSYKCKKGASVPTDLTGYTVTVPSGWVSTPGYGNFDIFLWQDSNHRDFGNGLNIGYMWGGSDSPRLVSTTDSLCFGIGEGLYDSSDSLYFEIIEGTDVTNQRLIDWFVSNGATFTKVEEVVLINFHISGMRFSAEEGMTWSEWVNSSYNTMGFLIVGNGLISNGAATIAGVVNTDVIIENKEYTFDTSGFE